MHPEDIKAAIRKKGFTLSEMATMHGLKPQALSRAIHGRSSSNVERVIAEFLGKRPIEIWPSRYDKKGNRLSLLAEMKRENA